MKQIFKQRGFTLIELLVVIAIIGILASVVLASLNSARDKGADAAAKSSLNNMRAQAELSYDNNSNEYDNVCADIADGLAAAENAAGPTDCGNSTTAWAAQVELLGEIDGSTAYYCVDSTGVSTTTTTDFAPDNTNPECSN